ncbi:hypothetical protein [Anaeromyxobacter sp. PSR-1]|nr:hypothetical protein [Anaeromyxobacter sp. PSR-1]
MIRDERALASGEALDREGADRPVSRPSFSRARARSLAGKTD